VVVTKSVYLIEDAFEKLPFHWMWWPALGGVGVGIIGFVAPKTLGVGYQNITDSLTGVLPVSILISLCFWKFLSWAIALGSGTSGGTLAPLLTIGSALGCLVGMACQQYFPEAHVSLPLAALVGMAALFAGASRAILTSIVFAMETTMQESTLLPLMAGCSTAYLVSFIMMRSTIMTEKIRRRGIRMPENYRPDLLELKSVGDIMSDVKESVLTISHETTIREIREYLVKDGFHYNKNFILVMRDKFVAGFLHKRILLESDFDPELVAKYAMNQKLYTVYKDNPLDLALEFMLKTKQEILPVLDRKDQHLIGVITESDILKAFEKRFVEDRHIHQHISIKDKTLEVLKRNKITTSDKV
jgi:CBS domain-containing protein